MDKTTLVDADIQAGHWAAFALERAGLPVAAAMWLKARDGAWQFYVASPDVETHGPITVYKFIDRILRAGDFPLSIDDVVAANTTNHFVNAIAASVSVTDSVVHITNCMFNGVQVDDAIVYKVARGVKPSPTPPRASQASLKKARELAE